MKILTTAAIALAVLAGIAAVILLGRTGSQAAEIRQLQAASRSDRAAIAADRAVLAADKAVLASSTAELATLRKPATAGHLGFCFQQQLDIATGDVDNVTISAPTDSGGVPSCPTGSFVSIVPGA